MFRAAVGVTLAAAWAWLYVRHCKKILNDLQNLDETLLERVANQLNRAKVAYVKRKRPLRIILIRHGESAGNVDSSAYGRIPDAWIPLTDLGRAQALAAGTRLRQIIGNGKTLFISSPYYRTQQTLLGILRGGCWAPPQSFLRDNTVPIPSDIAPVATPFINITPALAASPSGLGHAGVDEPFTHADVRVDPRIREQEWGAVSEPEQMRKILAQREEVGRFFYRFPNGESGADVFDRASSFLQSLYRQMDNTNSVRYDTIVIVSHGLFNRLFLMRYFRWSVSCFESIENFNNCEMCVLVKSCKGYYELTTDLRLKGGALFRPSWHAEGDDAVDA